VCGVAEELGVEVDEEPQWESTGAEVEEQLGFVDVCQLSDGLEFDDDGVLDEQIDALAFDDGVFVDDGDLDLGLGVDVSEVEFVQQCLLVDGFEQARSEFSVDLDRGTDHIVSELLDVVWEIAFTESGVQLSPFFVLFAGFAFNSSVVIPPPPLRLVGWG
tara:strand:+ start:2550 stop:3029 length:480 start_codon:yes stop_codon:yes gene_type:complete